MDKQLNPIDGMTVVLEDRGQDFLEFDIKDGRVIAARPFQDEVWSGQEVLNTSIKIGECITLKADFGARTLLYPVVAKRPIEKVAIGPVDV